MLFLGKLQAAVTMRVDNVPASLEPYLPSKELQSVRIAQLTVGRVDDHSFLWSAFARFLL